MATAANHHGTHSSSSISPPISSPSSPFSIRMRTPANSCEHVFLPPPLSHLTSPIPGSYPSSCIISSSHGISTPSSIVCSLPGNILALTTPNPLTWFPQSPHSPEPPTTLQLVQRLFNERSNVRLTATSDKYITVTRKFHDVSDLTYRAILRMFFPGDARPRRARIDYYGDRRLVIITLPGLPHELMTSFDANMQQSLVAQGFLWPGWGHVWLGSSGATTISLTHRKEHRKLQPDGGLQVLCQELPFMIVEVANSQDYHEVLEKASWILESYKGKIRFAIVIKLVNRTTKERREVDEADEDEHQDHNDDVDDDDEDDPGRVSGKRSLGDLNSSPPPTVHKRVRTSESSSSFGSPQSSEIHDETSGDYQTDPSAPPPSVPQSESLSELSSVDSINSLPSTNDNYFPVAPTANDNANHDHGDHYSFNSSPPSIDTPSAATIPPSEPPSPTLPPPPTLRNPRATFSRALVIVLGSVLTGSHRNATTFLDCIEFWPTPPRPQDEFSFAWDDMPTPPYPDVLRGRRYTLDFMWLHSTLDVNVQTTDHDWVVAHPDLVMGEWKEETSSGPSGNPDAVEHDGDEQETGDEEGGDGDRDSDADYQE